MPEHQALTGRMAIPGGPLKARGINGLRCKRACGTRYAFQWLARRSVNQTGDFKSLGDETGKGLSGRRAHGQKENALATCVEGYRPQDWPEGVTHD